MQRVPASTPRASSSIASKLARVKNNGRWSQKEKLRFLQALKMYKRNWKAVEKHVKTRTSTQARSHAQKFFQKLKKRGETLSEVFARLPLVEVKDNDEPVIDDKNDFLNTYLVDGNFDMGDLDEDCPMDDESASH